MIHDAPKRPDDDLVGKVILMVPSMVMLEVITASRSLDVALVEKLNMEGGRTNRTGVVRPSLIKSA